MQISWTQLPGLAKTLYGVDPIFRFWGKIDDLEFGEKQ